MEVYIEYVLIDNFIINFLILSLTLRVVSFPCGKLRRTLSALLGALFALALPFITLNDVWLLLCKLALGLIMVLMLKKNYSIKEFIATFLFFITFTFAFGGICFAICFMFAPSFSLTSLIIMGNEFPVGIVVLLLYFYFLFLIKLIQYFKHKSMISHYVYEIAISINGKVFKLLAFLDSGNDLMANEIRPVIVISMCSFAKMFKNLQSYKLFLNCVTPTDIKNSFYMDIKTINNTQKMLIVEPDRVDIKVDKNNTINSNALLGLSKQNFKNYDCLLNKNCF